MHETHAMRTVAMHSSPGQSSSVTPHLSPSLFFSLCLFEPTGCSSFTLHPSSQTFLQQSPAKKRLCYSSTLTHNQTQPPPPSLRHTHWFSCTIQSIISDNTFCRNTWSIQTSFFSTPLTWMKPFCVFQWIFSLLSTVKRSPGLGR